MTEQATITILGKAQQAAEAQGRNAVDRANELLAEANERLSEYESMLAQLTAPPLQHAPVVGLKVHKPKAEVEVGDKVRLRVGSEFYDQSFEVGEVVRVGEGGGDDHAWCEVVWPDTGNYDYRAYLGKHDKDNRPVDLELAEPQPQDRVTLLVSGKAVDVMYPEDQKLNVGDTVLINGMTMGIVESLGRMEASSGTVLHVKSVSELSTELDIDGRTVSVLRAGVEVKRGDRVILDQTGTFISRNLGQEESHHRVSRPTGVTWDMIGGLERAKQEMIEAVELPHTRPDVFKFYGKKPPRGVLLYGPPGCGKTMLGRAAAHALATIYGLCDSGFFYVKGPELLTMWVGATEEKIRALFNQAKLHKEKHGFPGVIFIDEADALLGRRGASTVSHMESTVVPMFLTEMDGIEESSAIVILATNRHDTLDPAVLRDGRIDRKIRVGRPGLQETEQILKLNLSGVPLHNGYTTDELAKECALSLFSEKRVVLKVKTDKQARNMLLCHAVNGALVAGVVEKAVSSAMRRDLSTKKGRPQGVKTEDLMAAIDMAEHDAKQMDNRELAREFAESFNEKVEGTKKA